MNRENLEHIIRAASRVSDEYEIVIVGSQSVLGDFPNAPSKLLFSMEADVYPLKSPEKSDLIDGSIGEYSTFHETFGYYAQGVSPETAVLPDGWDTRLTRVTAVDSVGYCISVHDLAVSKMVANREKDIEFVKVLIENNMVIEDTLIELAATIPNSEDEPNRVERVTKSIQRLFNHPPKNSPKR